MKTYFSIFYVGGLYAYIFKNMQNINLIFIFFFLAFCVYTLSMAYTVYLAKNNDNFIKQSIEDTIGEDFIKSEKRPFLSKVQFFFKRIYSLFFLISIIIVPFFDFEYFSAFILLVNATFVFLNIYYYIIIKDKLRTISDEVYQRYQKEKNDIQQFKEIEDRHESEK